MKPDNAIVPHAEALQELIHTLRGMPVMLDRDLASLYQVEMLVSQSVIPSKDMFGGALPFIFTEHGVAALPAVLISDRAIEIHGFAGRIHFHSAYVGRQGNAAIEANLREIGYEG